jgi:hypothetical protein
LNICVVCKAIGIFDKELELGSGNGGVFVFAFAFVVVVVVRFVSGVDEVDGVFAKEESTAAAVAAVTSCDYSGTVRK